MSAKGQHPAKAMPIGHAAMHSSKPASLQKKCYRMTLMHHSKMHTERLTEMSLIKRKQLDVSRLKPSLPPKEYLKACKQLSSLSPVKSDFKPAMSCKLVPLATHDNHEVKGIWQMLVAPALCTRLLHLYFLHDLACCVDLTMGIGATPLRHKFKEIMGNWEFRRTNSTWRSDMVWVHPANDKVFLDFLSDLATYGLGDLLKHIATCLEIPGACCFTCSYIVMSEREEGEPTMHVDLPPGFYTMLISVNLCSSNPELCIDGGKETGPLKYKYQKNGCIVMEGCIRHETQEVLLDANDIHKAILEWNKKHFHQATDTPFGGSPNDSMLFDLVRYSGMNAAAKEIVEGTFLETHSDNLEILPGTEQLIKELAMSEEIKVW